MRGIPWLAEDLLASQERLCPMELIKRSVWGLLSCAPLLAALKQNTRIVSDAKAVQCNISVIVSIFAI